MKTTTEDAIADGIYSNEFGAFTPPASLPLVTSDREIVAMAGEIVRGAWIIPPDVFKELPKKLFEIAMSGTRTAVKAAKVLLDMHAQNGAGETNIDPLGIVTIFIPDNGRDSVPIESTPVEGGGR